MRQYTTPEQTAKLIELGFEKPKGWYVDGVTNNIKLYVNIDANPMMFNYSIGELIEILPTKIEAEVTDEYDSETFYLNIEEGWAVSYFNGECAVEKCTRAPELIDALYAMILQLKEEGVI